MLYSVTVECLSKCISKEVDAATELDAAIIVLKGLGCDCEYINSLAYLRFHIRLHYRIVIVIRRVSDGRIH